MQPDDTDVDTTDPADRPSAPEGLPLPTVPGYRLVRRLGQGGMAVVYLAVQESLDREVAVKVMAPSASVDEAQAQRFEREARIIAKLEHPGIVGIHEVGRTLEGRLYYVMPYLARGDLSQRDYRDGEARIVDLLRALLDALGYAHARGIVHRDVKAENVLFNNADRPQLTDFGIAVSRRSSARITSEGLALGSGGYMSPEQARGEPVDGRADLYSLGVLTYELLTGELPYHAEDGLALALLHAQDPVPNLPPEKAHWQEFLDTAMAKSPDKRYRNAQAMTRALDPIARHLQPRRGWRALVAHPAWRRPPVLVAAGLLLAVALSALLLPRLNDVIPLGPRTIATETVTIPPEAVEPTPSERVQAALALRLTQARQQLDAGALIAPAGANAAESFLTVLRTDPQNADAATGLDQVFAALGKQVVAAVEAQQRDAARERYEEARLVAESAQWQTRPSWAALQTSVRGGIALQIERAMNAADRKLALSWATLPSELGIEDDTMRSWHTRVTALPDDGRVLRDAGGPELAVIPSEVGRSRVEHAFALMTGEVTRGEYAAFAAQTKRAASRCRNRFSPLQLLEKRAWNDPGFDQGGSHPAVCVSFEDARAYAAWLTRRLGHRYRLPTLSEWRHAAQTTLSGALCAHGNVADRASGDSSALACSDGREFTAPTRSYRANALALFDVVGNASEWTLSCGESGNPLARLLDSQSCPRRVAAGMSWRDGREANPVGHQQPLDPSRGYDDVGFRLVREL